MAIDKLIPQYLNSDTDQKLVKSVEMTDNLNVRVSNDDEGTAGVIKNIKGTDVVSNKTSSDAFPSGDNRVIGSVANEKNKEILFLVWNSASNHGLYRLDMTSGKYQKLYQDSVLNFKKFSYVDCDIIVNEENETLFYWTDNVNPPMKVNVNRLISGGYPSSLTSGTDEEKLLCLTVAKQRPLSPPSYTLVNNSSLDRNAIREKHFQFAYRYKYADGEVSALSDWSSHTFASTQVKSDFLEVSSKDFYNQINVFVKNTVADAEKITVYAKELNSQTFYEIEELSNNFTSNSSTINFTNNKLGSALSLDEINKSYDNVPQVAKVQAITGNRLMYGNYTEGYENYLPELGSNVVYRKKEPTYTIKAYVEDNNLDFYQRQSSIVGVSDYEIKLDYSSLPSTVPANSFINIEFVLVAEKLIVYADEDIKHTAFTFDFTTNEDILSNKINDSIVFTTGTRQTPRQSAVVIPLKNTVFKENFRSGAVKSKSQMIAEINNRLSTNTFTGIVDSDRNQETDGLVYREETLLFGLVAGAKAKIYLEGTASFKLQQAALVNDIKTFYLRFAGASLSVKQAEIIDYDYIPTTITSYPVAVEITNAPVHKIGGESGFNINTLFTVTTEAKYDNSGISGTSSYIATSLEGYSSFKSDSQHSFGIVYTDDRGRTSGVNKIDPVFVKAFSDRDAKGGSLVDFRIKSQAPSWAKKWQMVYGGNSSVDKFLQYTVASPLIPKDKDEFVSENLYISFNTLEGSNNSYKEKTGANLEYKYEEGDILKIIRYENSSGSLVYPEDHEFRVIGYEKLEEDADRFLAPAGRDFQTKFGWVLKLEDVDKAGFSFNTVKQGNGLWENNVVVEIYSPKKELEEKVYYGVGKTYDVVSKQHYGDRTIASNAGGALNIDGAGGATSSDRFYVGDEITVSGTVITIVSVTVETDGTFSYQYRGVVSAQSLVSTTVNNFSDANVTISRGDVFFRARRLVTRDSTMTSSTLLSLNWDESSFSTIVDFIEDYSISDFYRSSGFVTNKPYAFIPDSKTIRRRSSITYSDAYVIDSDRLNLSSFNLSLANWTDLDLMHGSINSLVPRGDALTVIQESKASQLPIGKNIIEFSSGNANVTASKNVLGGASYYAGDYGTSSPESVVERFGVVYFVDAEAGKVIRLSSDGITPISEKGVDSFFENKFKSLISTTEKIRVVGGFDPDNNEYLVTVEPVFNSRLTIASDVFDVPVNADAEFTIQGINYTSSTVLWNIWGNLWNTYCGEWQHVGNGIVFIDSVFQTQSILVDSAFLGSTATIKVIVTDSAYSFSAIADLNLSTGKVTMPSATCEGDSITLGSADTEEAGFTIAYKHKEGVWGSKYSFKPTMYVNINNELYSFFETDSGIMWKHNVNATRNNFYGTQYSSQIESVSNRNPSMIKVFEALAVEGSGTWSGTLTTSDQSTTIGTSDFDVREGHRYAMIPRDTLASKGHQIYIGKVESIASDKVTFTTPVNRLPFVVGDILKTASGSSLSGTGMQISGITDRKTIQCTTGISNISVGNNVFVEHSARIDGDPMRDVFLKIKLTSTDTTAFEVHALSLSYDRSRLHNDRVN
jgi:hypothetical protein